MERNEIMKYVDHTLLKPTSTWNDIKKLCEEAISYNVAAICIPSSYVKKVRENYQNLNIATVIGFPLGYQTTKVKVYEAKQAINEGANEIDFVINLGDVKNKEFNKITEEIRQLKKEVGKKILKVIVETCYLTEEEKVYLCKCVTDAGADYIKTSTGFGDAGARIEDVELFNKHLGKNVKIKASGGIRTKQEMEEYINIGCERLGTSSAIKILFNNN